MKHGTTTLRGRDRTLRQPAAKTEASRYEANAGFLSAIRPKLEMLGLICDLSFNPKSGKSPSNISWRTLCLMSHKRPLLDVHGSSLCGRNHKHEQDMPPSRLPHRCHSQAFFARSAPLRLVGGAITELTTRICGSTTRPSAPEALSASKQNMFSSTRRSAELHCAPFAWTAASDMQRFGESPAACHVSTTARDRAHSEACLCTRCFYSVCTTQYIFPCRITFFVQGIADRLSTFVSSHLGGSSSGLCYRASQLCFFEEFLAHCLSYRIVARQSGSNSYF